MVLFPSMACPDFFYFVYINISIYFHIVHKTKTPRGIHMSCVSRCARPEVHLLMGKRKAWQIRLEGCDDGEGGAGKLESECTKGVGYETKGNVFSKQFSIRI